MFPNKERQILGAGGGGTLKFRSHLTLSLILRLESGGQEGARPVQCHLKKEPLASQSTSLSGFFMMFTSRQPAISSLTKPAPSEHPTRGRVPRVSNAYDNMA